MTRIKFAAAILLLGATAVLANVQDKKPGNKKAESAGVTDERLKEMLENMGYEYTEVKNTAGGPSAFRMKMTRGNWNLALMISLSRSRNWVWLSVKLLELPETGKVRVDILEKLLHKNADIAPMTFNCAGAWLYLDLPIPAEGIKPARLRRDIEDLLDTVIKNEELWNPAKYPELATDV